MASPETKLYVGCRLINAPEEFREKLVEIHNDIVVPDIAV